jgi:hypothetical protein
MKSKSSQIYFKRKIIQHVMSIHYQLFDCKKIICVTTILGELNVLSPFWVLIHKKDFSPQGVWFSQM